MKLIIFSFIFTSISFGNEYLKYEKFSEEEIFLEYSGKFYSFLIQQDKKFLISSHCIDKANFCRAKDILFRKIKLNKTISLKGGVNLGAIICANYLSGETVAMKNKLNNKVSICEFKDKSMISTGILEKLIKDK